jgi:hypothetical protein
MFLSTVSTEQFFSKIKISYDCEFLVAQPLTKEENGEIKLSLEEVYQDHPSRALQKYPVAHWTSTSGFMWPASPLLKRRANLHGIAFRVGVVTEVKAERISSVPVTNYERKLIRKRLLILHLGPSGSEFEMQ